MRAEKATLAEKLTVDRLKGFVEQIGGIALGILELCYVLRLLVVNSHLSQYGIYSLSLFRVRSKGCFLLLILLFACLMSGTVAAEPAFVFEEPLRFIFTIPRESTSTVSFLIFSKEGTITQASVQVRDIKGPDGQSYPTANATPVLSPTQVTQEGNMVSLKIDSSIFRQPGEYRVVLLFQGVDAGGKPLTAVATPIITYPAAEINLEELKDQTFELYRNCPWGTANQTFKFYLEETSGKSSIIDMQVSGQAIYIKETKTRVPGQVTVKPVMPGSQPAASNANPADQPAPGTEQSSSAANLCIAFEDLQKAGAFQTSVVVNSPSLGGRKVIPLRVLVTDHAFWPFLAILIGVIGGFVTNYVSSKWRPQQLNRATLLRLQNEVHRFRQLVRTPEKSEKIDNLWSRLRNAEDRNGLGDAANIKTQLEQVEKDLDEFRKSEAKAKADTQSSLTAIKNQVEDYAQEFSPLEPDEEAKLHSIRDRLRDAEWLLWRDQVDYANEKLTAATTFFTNLKRSRLTKYLEKLEAIFAKLQTQTNPSDQQESARLRGEANTLLAQGKLDEAREKLDELKLSLESLSTKAAGMPRAARGPAPVRIEAAPQIRTPPDRLRIDIKTRPEERSTDREIQFDIIDPQHLLQNDDRFRWNFGESGSQRENGRAISYRYREYGNYEVRVDVVRDGQVLEGTSLLEPVAILPGEAAREALDIREGINKADLAVSAVALVLATMTGLLFLYVGKSFGSLSDYLLALLWGFGIDNSVRGFASVIGKITSSGGPT